MEQSSPRYHPILANPKHGPRYELYRLGVEGDEGESEIQSQPAILGGPCARGKLGPCARGSRGHGTRPCTRGDTAMGARAHGVVHLISSSS